MNELKPVASICVSHWRGAAGMENIELQMRVDLPDGVHQVYAIPDTHRVVSVELLERLQYCAEASPFAADEETFLTLRAIIDKEQS